MKLLQLNQKVKCNGKAADIECGKQRGVQVS